jgi:hypothetical protein
VPTVNWGGFEVVIERACAEAIGKALVLVWAGGEESVTVTVIEAPPVVVGVPERTPLELRFRPNGAEPVQA